MVCVNPEHLRIHRFARHRDAGRADQAQVDGGLSAHRNVHRGRAVLVSDLKGVHAFAAMASHGTRNPDPA